MNRTAGRRFTALLACIVTAIACSFCAFAVQPSVRIPKDSCTAIVGTKQTFTASAQIESVSSSRKKIASVSCKGDTFTVNPKATGDTAITVTYRDASSETFDVYVYASQAQYDFLKTVFQGKVLSVLGDSISTLEPWDDDGASYYYDVDLVSSCEPDGDKSRSGKSLRRRDIYWGNIQTRFDMKLGNIVSWRGKTVVGWMEDNAQIGRLGKNGSPDVIFFYGGSNDIRGKKDVAAFQTSYSRVLTRLKTGYPRAKIIVLLPCAPDGYEPYNAAAMQACDRKNVEYVNLAESGVTKLHPNANGFSKEVGFILDTLYAHHAGAAAQPETAEQTTEAVVTETPPQAVSETPMQAVTETPTETAVPQGRTGFSDFFFSIRCGVPKLLKQFSL